MRKLLVAFAMLAALVVAALPGSAGAQVTSPATANALAVAMGVPAGQIVTASLGTSDTTGVGVSGPLAGFPVAGADFAILSSGDASDADQPDTSGSLSTTLGGLNNSQGNDLVTLYLELDPPANAVCAAFDFVFLSEEFPEFVGSSFNDAFTAEHPMTNQTIVGNQVTTPFNFAFDFDANGNPVPISVNTSFGFTLGTGTTYDGATPLLTAAVELEPALDDGNVDFWLSIQDLGDSIYDSAVFLDNFRWLTNPDCKTGTTPGLVDTDGDALLDVWETDGVDFDSDGTIDLDLPAMGADPDHKDIFVEVDYMVEDPLFCIWFLGCFGGHSHRPDAAALTQVIDAFANAPVSNPDGVDGITIHIDAGPGSVMDPTTGATWGALSESSELPHDDVLGASGYDWTEFQALKDANFPLERGDVFHYNIWGHEMPGGSSGISRGIPGSDFIVTLSGFRASPGGPETVNGTVTQQAGTFMHELGHNLELSHGGSLDEGGRAFNYKPNYLSIMNYSFQLRGLRFNNADGLIDYSFADLDDLDETDLDETVGLTPAAGLANYGTIYFCGVGGRQVVNTATGAIDWNCDGTNDASVSTNINQGRTGSGAGLLTLSGWDDWDNIRFDGGAVGLGDFDQPAVTELDEPSLQDFIDAGLLLEEYAVAVSDPGTGLTAPGAGVQLLDFAVTNAGDNDDTYGIAATSATGLADLGGVPSSIAVAAGANAIITVPVPIAPDAPAGLADAVTVTATSTTNSLVSDVGAGSVLVVPVALDNVDDLLAAVIAALEALAAERGDDVDDLDDTIEDLREAAGLLGGDAEDQAEAVDKVADAVDELADLVDDEDDDDEGDGGADPLLATQIDGIRRVLATIAGTVAGGALDQAEAQGGDAGDIAEGRDELAAGDIALAEGRLDDAAEAYADAADLAAESLEGDDDDD